MTLDYSDRRIFDASVNGLVARPIKGQEAIHAEVMVCLSSIDSAEPGPVVKMTFAFPATGERPFREIEAEALSCAAGILSRLGKETAETLREAIAKPAASDEFPDALP